MRHVVSPDSVTTSCTRDLNAVAAVFKWKKLTRNLLDSKTRAICLFVFLQTSINEQWKTSFAR